MKRLHVLIIKSFIGPFIFMFLLSVFIFLMISVWRYIEQFAGKGLSIGIIAEFFGYIAISTVPMALPLSILLASIMAFGSLGEHYELSAIKSSGIPISKLMRPLIIIAILLSIGAFFFSNNILPVTSKKVKTLLWDIQKQNPTFILEPGVFNKNIPGWNIKVKDIDSKTGMMYGIIIYQQETNTREAAIIIAEKGRMDNAENIRFLNVILFNGAFYSENTNKNTYPFRKGMFEKYTFPIELPSFELKRSDGENFKSDYPLLNIFQLIKIRDSLRNVYNGWKDNYAHSLKNSSYLRKESYRMKKDTSYLTQIKEKYVDTDSILSVLNLRDVRIAVSSALIDAETILENNKKSITFNHQLDRWLRMYDIYWHKKFTLSLACVIFFFVGAPLGTIIRKGGIGMPVVVSTILFISYHLISNTSKNMMREDQIDIVVGSWLPFFIFLPLGIFLTFKATSDSQLLNTDAYWKIINKILLFQKKLFAKSK